ncbi:MBL fold metallo-hydrolase [Undibacterium sp. WLHG33]|uniref:MBL fold metallo-hydrolase n=1 Tax=Undibacterium sp. WLHG33 TaxID=3412482 RepID=UPI003C2EBBAC
MNEAIIHSFFDEATNTVTHIVTDPSTKKAAVIDSVLDFDAKSGRTSTSSADKLIQYVETAGLTVDWLLETHAHADHLSAAPYLKKKLGGKIGIGAHICDVQKVFKKIFNADDISTRGEEFDHLFNDGDEFLIGELKVRVIHTPGHTPACVTYLTGKDAFVGDTLFMPDYGTARCDFPGGDAATLYQSIQRLFQLPADTRLHLCHDYPPDSRSPMWITTVEAERKHNVHVHDGVSQPAFISMREARDKTLSMPNLILPSVQINIRAGQLPPAESNGISYMKLPINAL